MGKFEKVGLMYQSVIFFFLAGNETIKNFFTEKFVVNKINRINKKVDIFPFFFSVKLLKRDGK